MSAPIQLRFNKQAIQNLELPAPGTRATFHDTVVNGLQLRITSSGVKSFCVLRRSKGGDPERITLGRYPDLSVELARTKAKRCIADLGQGISVRTAKRERALQVKTLDQVHREYLASRGVTIITIKGKGESLVETAQLTTNAKLKVLTARDYVNIVAKLLADWRKRPLSSITRDCIEARHRQLSKRSEARANLVMRYLRALFSFASEYRDAKGQPLISDNPVRRLSTKRLWNRIERRTRYIEPEQLGVWWETVNAMKNTPQHPCIEVLRDYLILLLLTGLRREEGLTLRWEHINLENGTLRVVETKNGSQHVLPMGQRLWETLRQRREATDGEWVFANPLTGQRVTNPCRQISQVSKRSGIVFSAHDLRRTFASIVSRHSDSLSYYTIKRLLNHRISDVTQGYIQFDTEHLRRAMQAVEDFVLQRAIN